jgi:hypothetical protein
MKYIIYKDSLGKHVDIFASTTIHKNRLESLCRESGEAVELVSAGLVNLSIEGLVELVVVPGSATLQTAGRSATDDIETIKRSLTFF